MKERYRHINVAEAAEMFSVSQKSIREALESGDLVGEIYENGTRFYTTPAFMEAWIVLRAEQNMTRRNVGKRHRYTNGREDKAKWTT